MVELKSPIVETNEDFEILKESDFLNGSIVASCCHNSFDGEIGLFLNIIVDYKVEPKMVDGYIVQRVEGVLLNPKLLDLWNSTYPHLCLTKE